MRGNVDSMAQKDLTTEYARDVEGVTKVNNEMTVSAMNKKPAESTVVEKVGALLEAVDDASITALVKTTLRYHRSTSALKPTVETHEGIVSMQGNATTAAQKDLATKLVSDLHGVKKVVNNMTVE